MIKFILKNLNYIVLSPIFLNFFLNLKSAKSNLIQINLYDIASSFLLFLFLYFIGSIFKSLKNNLTITFGIITYLISFYLVELIILFFYKEISLHSTFIIVNTLWLMYFLISKIEIIQLFKLISSFLMLRIFTLLFFDKLTKNSNIIGDVKDVFLPNTVSIYEKSLFYSLTNPVELGYPQFMSYLDAILYRILASSNNYHFVLPTTLVFLFLFSLMIFETKLKKTNRILGIFLLFSLFINSKWLQFLFITSLMSERVASFIFLGLLICLFEFNSDNNKNLNLIYFVFSFVFVTKQFFSILIIFIFFITLISNKYRKYSYLLLSSFFIRQIIHSSYLSEVPTEHHIRQIDLMDTIFDLLFIRDLQFKNVFTILQNLFIDKPSTYIILLFFFLNILQLLLMKQNVELENLIYFVLSTLNFLFIILLYISVWKNMELESPIRYIYSFIPVYIFSVVKILDNFQLKYLKKIQ